MTKKNRIIDSVNNKLFANSVLQQEPFIRIEELEDKDLDALAQLYLGAYERGDWFGGRLNSEANLDSIRDLLESMIVTQETSPIKFSDKDGNILGSTLLEYSCSQGILIDETQIDPVLGRRKGIMTAYFRRLIPILNQTCKYWTEFVITPTSRVLRKVLIGEYGMVPLAFFPGLYVQANGNRLSNLVAYGPPSSVWPELAMIGIQSSNLAVPLRFLEQGFLNSHDPRSKIQIADRKDKPDFEFINVVRLAETKLSSEHMFFGLVPYERQLIYGTVRNLVPSDVEILASEDNVLVENLVRQIYQ